MMKFSKLGFCATCLIAIFTLNLSWLWLGLFILSIGIVVEAFMTAPVSRGYTKEKKSSYNEREHEIYYHLYLNKRR